jgi:DNA-directed RNA polymerase specialized sigma24 family protein
VIAPISSSFEQQWDPPAAADQRLRHVKALSDELVERAASLPPGDRQIVLAVYRDNLRACEVARLCGREVRYVNRRVRSLVQRMLSDRFAFVLRNRSKWSATKRNIATLHFLQGMTMRETASALGVSFYSVRRVSQEINVCVREGLR